VSIRIFAHAQAQGRIDMSPGARNLYKKLIDPQA
jgi:hypothetical protein